MLVLGAALLGAPAASADPLPGPVPTDPVATASLTDRLVFATPIDQFVALRDAAYDAPRLDWSSDLCSVPVVTEPQRSVPQGFDFRAACERHDFGYRNYKAQGRFTEDLRRRVDDGFLADMDAVCAAQSGWFGLRGVYCRHIADDYHFWVRSCGAAPAPYCPLEARDFVEYARP